MKRRGCVAISIALAVLLSSFALRAETRDKPFTEEQLVERSSAVFVGEVLETTAINRCGRRVPTRTRVLVSIKGKVPLGERDLVAKDPAKFAYFDEEFSQATKGGLGVFFISADGEKSILMGYKEIPAKDDAELAQTAVVLLGC
jgi:hypothetical protein